jgi:hypothetical protein
MTTHIEEQVTLDQRGLRSEGSGLLRERKAVTESLPRTIYAGLLNRLELTALRPEDPGRLQERIQFVQANREKTPELPRLRFVAPARSRPSFIPMQQWEGFVLAVEPDTFRARVRDLASGEDEEAELQIEDVSLDDRSLIAPGAVFYWSIGRQTDSAQRQSIVSQIRFRRLPALSDKNAKELKDRARARYNEIAYKIS